MTTQTATQTSERAIRTDIRDCKTTGEVLEKAGLNYNVDLAPLFSANPRTGQMVKVDTGHRSVIRRDTGETIAVVGSRYTPIQTADFMARLAPIVDAGTLKFVSALSIDSGRAIVIEAQLPKPIVVKAPNGKEDVLLRRLLYNNTYDGTKPMTLSDSMLRQWCTNGATSILGMESYSLRHTSSSEYKAKEIVEAVGASLTRFQNVEANVRRLLATPFTMKQMLGVADRLYPVAEGAEVPTKTGNARDAIVNLFGNGQGTFGRSAWDAVNAITEWNTHHRPVRGDENKELARLRATWMGLDQTRSGYDAVLAEVAAAA
jgi:phage/plasmid-like protein (TIGR03299 family)